MSFKENRQPVFRMVDPKDAERFLALNVFPGQRKYSPLRGRQYADNMLNGSHRRVEIAVVRVAETNSDFLVNGQHNCHAIILYGKPYPAVVSYYSCKTMVDAWRLFATFDVHYARNEKQFQKGRRDLYTSEALQAVPLRTLSSCGSALYALQSDPVDFSRKPSSKTVKADLNEQNEDDVLFVATYTGNNHLETVGANAAMIATRRRAKDENALFEFWNKVASGEMMTREDQRRKLRDTLLDGRHFNGQPWNSYNRHKMTYALCIYWWNSWRSGDGRKVVKFNALGSIPKVSA